MITMKRVKRFLVLPLALAMVLSVSSAAADYTAHADLPIGDYNFSCNNYITASQYDCGASTTANSTLVAVSVTITYYYHDYVTDTDYVNGRGNGNQGWAGISAPTLSGAQFYNKIVSNHTAVYQLLRFDWPLTTEAPH